MPSKQFTVDRMWGRMNSLDHLRLWESKAIYVVSVLNDLSVGYQNESLCFAVSIVAKYIKSNTTMRGKLSFIKSNLIVVGLSHRSVTSRFHEQMNGLASKALHLCSWKYCACAFGTINNKPMRLHSLRVLIVRPTDCSTQSSMTGLGSITGLINPEDIKPGWFAVSFHM